MINKNTKNITRDFVFIKYHLYYEYINIVGEEKKKIK